MPHIIEITDFHAPELDPYARLTERQLLNRDKPEKGLFIAESPKVIERALDAGCVPVSLLLERKHIAGEARSIIERCGDIPVYTADFTVLTQLTGFNLTRGALCLMRRPKLPEASSIYRDAHRIAILENVMNPTNIGAIFRSAAALNMDAVLLTPACSNPLYRRAIRVSMGTVFQIPWTWLDVERKSAGCCLSETKSKAHSAEEVKIASQAAQAQAGMELLHRLGFKTAAMALSDNSIPIDDPHLMAEEKLAIVLGTEGDGLAPATIAECDYTVRIPMAHGVDSLNVAAASAVAFYAVVGE